MYENAAPDKIRKAASVIAFVTATFQGVFFIKILTIIDFAEQLHILVLLCAALVFVTVGFGLLALGLYCHFWILKSARTVETEK